MEFTFCLAPECKFIRQHQLIGMWFGTVILTLCEHPGYTAGSEHRIVHNTYQPFVRWVEIHIGFIWLTTSLVILLAACMNRDTHLQSRTRRHGPHTDQLFCNWHCLAVCRSLREGLMVRLSRAKQGQTPTECHWVSEMRKERRCKLCPLWCSTLTSTARRRQVWRQTGTRNSTFPQPVSLSPEALHELSAALRAGLLFLRATTMAVADSNVFAPA